MKQFITRSRWLDHILMECSRTQGSTFPPSSPSRHLRHHQKCTVAFSANPAFQLDDIDDSGLCGPATRAVQASCVRGNHSAVFREATRPNGRYTE